MTKTITLLAGIFISLNFCAQPVLSYDAAHGIGTQCNMYVIGGAVTALQQTGAALTWNLSSNSLSQVGTFNLVDPSATPSGSTYSSANLAFEMTVTGQGTTYTYLIDSPAEMNSIADNIGGSSPTIWTQYDKLFEYPFNYLDSFSCTRQASGGSPEPFVRRYDAYGSLTINGKTYNNVIRVTKNPGNSVWMSTSPLFPVIIQANSTTYLYNEPTTLSAINSMANQTQLSVWPNPARSKIMVEVKGSHDEITTFVLLNTLGKIIKQIPVHEALTELVVDDAPAGVYFYHLRTASGNMAAGKIMIE